MVNPNMQVDVKVKGGKKKTIRRLSLKASPPKAAPEPPKFEPRATLAYYNCIGGGFGTPRLGQVALGQFNVPAWMACRPSGELVVSSTFAHEVQLLSPRGGPIAVINRCYYSAPLFFERGHAAGDSEDLTNPQGVAVSADGGTLFVANVYIGATAVGSAAKGCVHAYDLHADGARARDTSGRLSELEACHGLCLVDDAVFVSAAGRKHICVLSASSLKLLYTFGSSVLMEPMDLDVYYPLPAAGGTARPPPLLYVTDRERHRVDLFSTSGDHVSSFGGEGTAPGSFKEPLGVAVRKQRVYVTEGLGARLQVLEPNGTPLLVLPAPTGGRLCGLGWHDNRLYVGEIEAHRIHCFKMFDE